jgi:hypothetical protein
MNLFTFAQQFAFKNILAMPLIGGLIYVMVTVPQLHDSCVVLLTLVVKYYYDNSAQSAKKDETIATALTVAQNTPGVPIDPSDKK